MSKITLASVKSFIRKNRSQLYVRTLSEFDGMTDCVQSNRDANFRPVEFGDESNRYTLGIPGAWFVGQSRDYFSPMQEGQFSGIHVYNCTGSFDLAVKS